MELSTFVYPNFLVQSDEYTGQFRDDLLDSFLNLQCQSVQDYKQTWLFMRNYVHKAD